MALCFCSHFDEAAAVAGPKQYSLNGLVMSLLNFSAQPISYCEWFKQFQIFSMVFCHCSSGKFKLFQLNLDMMELWTVNFSLVPRTKNEMKKHSRIQSEIAIHIVSHNEKEKNEMKSTFDWLSNFQMTLFKQPPSTITSLRPTVCLYLLTSSAVSYKLIKNSWTFKKHFFRADGSTYKLNYELSFKNN